MSPTALADLPSQLPVPVGAVQIKRGAADVAINVSNQIGAGVKLTDGAGGFYQISYTPRYPCFWLVKGNLMYQGVAGSSGGAWQNVDYAIYLTPADLDGRTFGYQAKSEVYDSGTVGWVTTAASCMFRLAAGIAYTAYLGHYYSSGFYQQYHAGALWSRIVGRIIGEGAV